MSPHRLDGRRILVTRHAPALTGRLREAGAEVFEVPTIAIGPPPDPEALDSALGGLATYDWIAFTSANAVRAVAEALATRGERMPAGLKVASVGRATTTAIADAWEGWRPDVEPATEFSAEGLLAAWDAVDVSGTNVFLPVSDRASDVLERGLAARGARVERVIAYTTAVEVGSEDARSALFDGHPFDLVVFASPSAVDGFVALAGEGGTAVPAAVIGPTTAEAARAAGLRVVVQPDEATLEALAASIRAAFSR